MRWSELDADAGTWTIPAERTKNGREHAAAAAGGLGHHRDGAAHGSPRSFVRRARRRLPRLG